MHTIIGNPKPYTLCNKSNLDIEGLDLNYPKFCIVPNKIESALIKAEKEVKVANVGMGMYIIENLYLLASTKYLAHPKIIKHLECQCHAEGISGHSWCENEGQTSGSYLASSLYLKPIQINDSPTKKNMGNIFPSPFVHKYMVENCKYKGGGLGKSE